MTSHEQGRLYVSVGSASNVDADGYPSCWSEYLLPPDLGGGPGTQWQHPDFQGSVSDAWCQDPAQVVPPAFAMPAHVAPLGIVFYRGQARGAAPNRDELVAALAEAGGNLALVARRFGRDRRQVYRWLERYDLPRP